MLKIFKGGSGGGGKASSLVTQDFAAVVERHRQLEAATTGLVKACKKCQEALLDMNKGRAKLREEVLALPLFDPTKHKRAGTETVDRRIKAFRDATESIIELGKGMRDNMIGAVDEPMRKFLKIYPSVTEQIRRHDGAAAEFERAKERCERQQRSGSADDVKLEKLERQRDAAQQTWELLDATLPSELQRLYEARVQYMEPTLLAMLQAEIKFLGGLAATLDTICEAREVSMSDEDYARDIETHFEQIAKLSITSDKKA